MLRPARPTRRRLPRRAGVVMLAGCLEAMGFVVGLYVWWAVIVFVALR